MDVIMNDLVKAGSQFIISTHSPILTSFPGAEIYQLTEEGIELVIKEARENLKNVPFGTFADGAKQLLAGAVVVAVHLLKRNTLLSIAAGTAAYMLLIRL